MAIIDREGIRNKITAERNRARQMGLSEEMESEYHGKLSPDCDDPAHDARVFNDLADALKLSEDDRVFMKKFLDSGDGR